MKRILFIGSFLSEKRGSQDVSSLLSLKLSQCGYKVRLISKFENRFWRLLETFFALLFYRKDIVLLDLYSGKSIFVNYLVVNLCRLLRIKCVVVLHGGALTNYYKQRRYFLNYIFKSSDCLVSPSKFLISFFASKGFKIEYIPNHINLELFKFVEKYNLKYKILWVRAFSNSYNPQVAVRVLNEVLKDFPLATLTMVGPDFGELERTKELASQLGIFDRVILTGPQKNKDLPDLYYGSDIYINTTTYESFGMTLFEAGCCGIPIVSNSVGEIPLIWTNKKNIILIDDNDINSYVQGIKLIFNDVNLRQNIINSARCLAQEYSWDETRDMWLDIINRY